MNMQTVAIVNNVLVEQAGKKYYYVWKKENALLEISPHGRESHTLWQVYIQEDI